MEGVLNSDICHEVFNIERLTVQHGLHENSIGLIEFGYQMLTQCNAMEHTRLLTSPHHRTKFTSLGHGLACLFELPSCFFAWKIRSLNKQQTSRAAFEKLEAQKSRIYRVNSLYGPKRNSSPFFGLEKFKLPSLTLFLSSIPSMAL